MKLTQYLTIPITSLLVLSCQPTSSRTEGSVETEKAVPTKETRQLAAKEVSRYEFIESAILQHPEDEKEFNHFYMGSLDGYDYISVRSKNYRIPSDQLELENNFPLTEDSAKWIPMRIHFSQIVIK